MASLSSIDKNRLEKILQMESGYVLDFSNHTFRDFVLEYSDLDINDEKYNFNSGSKANRLRAFWMKEPNYKVGKLITALLDHWVAQNEIKGNQISPIEYTLYAECKNIAVRLKQDVPIDNIDAITPNNDDRDFLLLADNIREAIEKGKPELQLDRLHTFVVKYVRQLCDKHHLQYQKEEAVHSIFAKYVKYLLLEQMLESVMSERILKSAISVLDAYNDVRNNQSFAHDNAILNTEEAIFIVQSITNSIQFIEIIEDKIDLKKQVALTSQSDLPF